MDKNYTNRILGSTMRTVHALFCYPFIGFFSYIYIYVCVCVYVCVCIDQFYNFTHISQRYFADTGAIIWASRRPQSPATGLFVQQLDQVNNSGTSKLCNTDHFMRGIHRWPVDSPPEVISNAWNVSMSTRHHSKHAVLSSSSPPFPVHHLITLFACKCTAVVLHLNSGDGMRRPRGLLWHPSMVTNTFIINALTLFCAKWAACMQATLKTTIKLTSFLYHFGAEFNLVYVTILLPFPLFLNTEMAQLVEFLPKRSCCMAYTIAWLLIPWGRMEPGHQQICY